MYLQKKKEQLEGLLTVLDKCEEYKHTILTGHLNSKSLDWNNKLENQRTIGPVSLT